MKTKILTVLLLSASSLLARIGETQDQCIARYGTALMSDAKTNMSLFQKGGMDITAFYRDGKVECISYTKSERDALDKPIKMSMTEIDALLSANGSVSKWNKTKSNPIIQNWTNEESGAVASYRSLDRILLIMTKECMQRTIEESKAKEKKALEGL